MNLRDLTLRLRALLAPRRAEQELEEELAFHIEREAHRHIEDGVSPEEARRRARARFGSIALTADQCRDTRGTSFIDDCGRDVIYAWRTFRRAPLAALTIVVTIAIGLGLVTVVFTALNVIMFRVDEVPNPGELFAVERPRQPDGDRVLMTWHDYEALRDESDVFVDAFAMLPDIDSRIDGRMMAGTLVTGNFFNALRVSPSLGRALTPADDARAGGQPVIVLSYKGWSRLFASDPTVIGRRLVVNGFPFEIVGVMPDGFRGLGVGAPDYWAPLSLLGRFRPIHEGHVDQVGIDIVGRLKPGLSRNAALAQLLVWNARHLGQSTIDRRPGVLLEPRQGTIPQPMEAVLVFTPLFFAFGLILMIGCANVANLLLARAVSRQREIGVRLSLGASRWRITRQLLTESLLLALAAAALGLAVSRVVLGGTMYAVTSTLAPELAENIHIGATPSADWRVVAFLVGGAIVATALFGLAPALQATRLELVRTIRGEVARDARPGRTRNWLIGIQVTASAVLLICAAVFLRSAFASSSFDPGMRTDDIVMIEIVNESKRMAMIQAVMTEPAVAAAAASAPDAFIRPRLAVAEAQSVKSSVAYRYVSPDYFTVLGIDVVRGRGFSQTERATDAGVIVVSESVARELWPGGNALGQSLRVGPDPDLETRGTDEPPLPSRTFTVVGIVRDVAGFRFAGFKKTVVYVPIDAAAAKTSLTVRVQGDPEQARLALLKRLTAIDPNMGQVLTMRTAARIESYFLRVAFAVTVALGGLALALTWSGLFSVLSYLVEQRKKEIGVRMALGATARNVGELVLSQSVRPVGFGLLAGGALAAGVGILLIATPIAAQIGEVVLVFDPMAYGASLLFIVTACTVAGLIPAVRAARIQPIVTLRQE